jgi:3-phenylpropionate/trans-cinnamate dioxygenase ferredoxin subunit
VGQFVSVAKAAGLGSGQMAAYVVSGKRIAVANVGGRYYAFDDTCTHRACSLTEGELEGEVVTCGCHFSEFSVRTGSVLTGPATVPVGIYAVRVEGPELQVEV